MKLHKITFALSALALAAASFSANAAVVFQNLGTAAPPTSIGGYTLTPFSLAPQNAIPDFSNISTIPGNPGAGVLGINPQAIKYPFSALGATWGQGYSGPIYATASTSTLTLPPNTHAFYFYTLVNAWGTSTFTATSDSGTNSGPISVSPNALGGPDSANGVAFYSTAGESISSITVTTSSSNGLIFAEFGIDTGPVTTCASSGYTGTQLNWCVKICESGLTGAALDVWLQRWIRQFRQLPYCALPGGGNPPPV